MTLLVSLTVTSTMLKSTISPTVKDGKFSRTSKFLVPIDNSANLYWLVRQCSQAWYQLLHCRSIIGVPTPYEPSYQMRGTSNGARIRSPSNWYTFWNTIRGGSSPVRPPSMRNSKLGKNSRKLQSKYATPPHMQNQKQSWRTQHRPSAQYHVMPRRNTRS